MCVLGVRGHQVSLQLQRKLACIDVSGIKMVPSPDDIVHRNEYLVVGGVSVRSRNGPPSRKGCVVDGQLTKVSNK